MGRGINPVHFNDKIKNPIADRFLQSTVFSGHILDQAQGVGGVDIIRLSMNVKRNLIKEREENTDQDNSDSYHSIHGGKGAKGGKNGAENLTGGKGAAAKEKGDDIDLNDKNI